MPPTRTRSLVKPPTGTGILRADGTCFRNTSAPGILTKIYDRDKTAANENRGIDRQHGSWFQAVIFISLTPCPGRELKADDHRNEGLGVTLGE